MYEYDNDYVYVCLHVITCRYIVASMCAYDVYICMYIEVSEPI